MYIYLKDNDLNFSKWCLERMWFTLSCFWFI